MALVYAEAFSHILEGTVIHGISSFAELVKTTTPDKDIDIIAVMRWLDVIFGK